MIDSVLKGTGNSRFLKSAVPAGTSWADALAMLQSGTFPIDFNGINTDGFQQVGTPLNKANLLKDATAAQIGLPPSTTPDGMFQALGNTGELHVWRKATVSVEAGYNLGNTQKNYLASASISGDSNTTVTFKVSESVSVSVDGKVIQNNPTDDGPWGFVYGNTEIQNAIRGKFISVSTKSGSGYSTVSQDDIWFIPITANISFINNGTSLGYPYKYCYIADKMQKVSGFPAGTTTTYPVSTNPNAYQEGSDAKPAGYTLGEVVTGQFLISDKGNVSTSVAWRFGDDVTVADDGSTSLKDPSGDALDASNYESSRYDNKFKGKFVSVTKNSVGKCSFDNGIVYFIPNDAIISKITLTSVTFGQQAVVVDRYQPVTGYAAIPAGTTIEYLGKLGDKARMQVVSYVGTGTSGSDNPVSITFDFVPKSIWVIGQGYNYESEIHLMHGDASKNSGDVYYFSFSRISWESKTVSWYNTRDDGYQASALQANTLGETYKVLAIS